MIKEITLQSITTPLDKILFSTCEDGKHCLITMAGPHHFINVKLTLEELKEAIAKL
jgi:hypothetical protein